MMQRHELLERVPLFKGLSEGARISLSQRLVERRCSAGELVFSKGDTGSAMFLLLSGRVEIFLPPEGGAERVDLKEVAEGEHFGELALFDEKPRSASAAAKEDCVLLELPRETRLFLCHDYKAPGRDTYAWETTIGQQRDHNVHVHDGITEDAFFEMRTKRDRTLAMPELIMPSVQVNIRGGRLPEPEDNGVSYIKIPLNAV